MHRCLPAKTKSNWHGRSRIPSRMDGTAPTHPLSLYISAARGVLRTRTSCSGGTAAGGRSSARPIPRRTRRGRRRSLKMAVSPKLRVFSGAESLAEAACRRIDEYINDALGERGVCSVALSGGETPRAVYRLLAAVGNKGKVDWARVHFFFGDERLVPPQDPDSNFGMTQTEMLSRLPVPAGNINRVRGELPAGEAVTDYRRKLREFFRDRPVRFDIILLGLWD